MDINLKNVIARHVAKNIKKAVIDTVIPEYRGLVEIAEDGLSPQSNSIFVSVRVPKHYLYYIAFLTVRLDNDYLEIVLGDSEVITNYPKVLELLKSYGYSWIDKGSYYIKFKDILQIIGPHLDEPEEIAAII